MKTIKDVFADTVTRIRQFWGGLSSRKKIGLLMAVVVVLTGAFIAREIKQGETGIKKLSEKNISKIVSDGFTRLEIPQRESPFFNLQPITENKFGILPKQTFVLKTKEPMEVKFLETHLKTPVPFEISAVSDKEFRLTPTAPISLGQVVNLALAVKDSTFSNHTFDRDYGWTYQTQGKFRVISTIPGDKKNEVPVNTGLEFVFSQDDYKDPTTLISVIPEFTFRTERHGETWVIVPLSPLTYKTVYTVTLKKGLNLESRDDAIKENYSFSFQTQEPQTGKLQPYLSINETFIQVTPQELPMAKIYMSNWPTDGSVRTEIYKFNTGVEFINSRKDFDVYTGYWYSYFPEDKKIDTGKLPLVTTADIKPQNKDQVNYLQLPEPLKPGWYLVQFWYNDHKKVQQMWVQSNFVSGYISSGRFQTLVWANDLETGSSLNEAKIQITGDNVSHYTSGNGLSVFGTPQTLFEAKNHYAEITPASGTSLYLPIGSFSGQENNNQTTATDYWSYLYHERTIYKPTDTVYFWGVAKNRDTNMSPGIITISLTQGYNPNENKIVLNKEVSVNSDGTYFGNISFSDLPERWYYLIASVDGTEISHTGLNILEYEKPEMKIEVSASKKAVFTGETMVFTAKASFFDGTPVRDVKLKVYEDVNGAAKEMVTDYKGEITYPYTPVYTNMTNYPRYESVVINPALAQGVTVEGDGSVYVYGSKLTINSEGVQDKNLAKMTAVVNYVDLEGVNSGKTAEVKGALAGNLETTVTVSKNWWEKVEDGTYYDFIEKVTMPAYHYNQRSEKVFEQKIKTDNLGAITHEFQMEKDNSYNVVVSVTDSDGHPAEAKEYFYYYDGNYSAFGNSSNSSPELTLDKKENTYSLGESVEVTIKQGGKVYAGTDKSRFLFILARRGRQDFYVEDVPKTGFAFEAKYIPNMTIGAVIFTGNHYLPVSGGCNWDWYCYNDWEGNYFSGVQVLYQKNDQKLDIELTTDKPKYKPGDTANISLTVSKNQQPIENSEVNLVLVDEALAAIGGVIKPTVLSTLYSTVPDQIYYTYYSHKSVLPDTPQAEKGGGGGDNRELFKDTSFFGRAKTDETGTAQFTFILPDNLTTWIMYGQAVTNDLQAGQTEDSLVVTKDFFVTNQFPREYLLSDKPILSTVGFGTALKAGDNVNYQAIFLQGEIQKERLDKSGKAFTESYFPAPALETGNYKAWAKGTTGELTDGLIYPFKVIDSRISFAYSRKYTLEKGQELINPDLGKYQSDKPINLVISDTGKGLFYHQLKGFCYTTSNRLEKKITTIQAAVILNNRFGEKGCPVDNKDLTRFQGEDGGLAQVWWGGSNLETTIWAVYVDPSAFDKNNLVNYLESQIGQKNSGSRQQIYAAWGLSMLGEPQINRLKTLADNSKTFEEKVLSGIALETIGETERARDLYFDILADYAYTYKPYIRIQRDNTTNMDQWLKDTAYTLLLGSLVDKTYDAGMYAYMKGFGRFNEDVVLDLSSMAFIDEEMAKLPQEDTQITVTTTKTQKTVTLVKGRSTVINLDAAEAGNLKLKVERGKTETNFHYFLGADALAGASKDSRLTIKRNYQKAKGDGPLKIGDIVKVNIEVDTNSNGPLGSYQVIDFLPSGLVYLTDASAYGLVTSGWISKTENDHRLVGYWANSPWWTNRGFTYYARAAFAGIYTAEPAIFQSNLDPTVFQTTGPDLIVISESQ